MDQSGVGLYDNPSGFGIGVGLDLPTPEMKVCCKKVKQLL